MRRTASLDALYLRPVPAWSLVTSTLLQLDKATQTEESFLERTRGSTWTPTATAGSGPSADSSPVITRTAEVTTPTTDLKMEKVIRQRLQRTHRGEHSVSSQTLSPNHGEYFWISVFFLRFNCGRVSIFIHNIQAAKQTFRLKTINS